MGYFADPMKWESGSPDRERQVLVRAFFFSSQVLRGLKLNRKGGEKMKRFCLAVFLCLVLFSGQAAAVIAPVADTVVGQFGGTAGGAVSFNQQANLGEFFLHTGEPFVFSNSGFDLNETHQFRYDWQTSAIEPSLGDMNSGSVYWTGTLQNFLDRQYSATLVIGGT
jgi:hypothetical protein